jgi:DNA polymerase I-like protein with 3'-5' exonuclease and polymerase domains
MKKSMADAWESGVYEVLTPHLTVHDESDVSVPRGKIGREAWREHTEIMEKTIKFKVPIVVDAALGRNWGEVR